jgi:hypothetical protein
VVEIAHRAHIEQERRLAVHPQRAGREHRALDAVRRAVAQHMAHRPAGVAGELEVLLQPVEEGLDLLRRVEPPQQGEFRRGQAEVLAPRVAFSHPASTIQKKASRAIRIPSKGEGGGGGNPVLPWPGGCVVSTLVPVCAGGVSRRFRYRPRLLQQ